MPTRRDDEPIRHVSPRLALLYFVVMIAVFYLLSLIPDPTAWK